MSVKHAKKVAEQKPDPDPLSGGKEEVVDPLTSLALASSADPLSAVLANPLSQAGRSSFGGTSVKVSCSLFCYLFDKVFSSAHRM